MLDLAYLQQSVEELQPVIRRLYGLPSEPSSLTLSHEDTYYTQLIIDGKLLHRRLPNTQYVYPYQVTQGIRAASTGEDDKKLSRYIDNWYRDGKVYQGSGWNIRRKILRLAKSTSASDGGTGERLNTIYLGEFSEVNPALEENVPWASAFGEVM